MEGWLDSSLPRAVQVASVQKCREEHLCLLLGESHPITGSLLPNRKRWNPQLLLCPSCPRSRALLDICLAGPADFLHVRWHDARGCSPPHAPAGRALLAICLPGPAHFFASFLVA